MSASPISASAGPGKTRFLSSGTRVRVIRPGPAPHWSEWDDDRGRVSGSVKRRLQELFFRGDKKLHAEIAWVTSESERDELARKGRVKVKVKEASGTSLVFTASIDNIDKA